MGKERKTKKKRHHRSSSSSPRKKHVDQSSSDDGSSSSSTEFDEIEAGKMKSIGAFINDRIEMVDQMFESLRGEHLRTIMPDILKAVPMDELKQMCVDELEGMSKKRIRCILAGEEMASSSGTDDSSTDNEGEEEMEEIAAPFVPNPVANLSLVKPVAIMEDDSNNQQPDSTVVEPDLQRSISPNNDDDNFGLDEPLVNIILDDPSPIRSPDTKDADVENLENDQDDGESNSKSVEPLKAVMDSDSEENEDESISNDRLASNLDENQLSDLEDGEISDAPKRKIIETSVWIDMDIVASSSNSINPNLEAANSNEVQIMEEDVGGSQKELDDQLEKCDSNRDDDLEDDDGLMAEIQAQDELLFGDIGAKKNNLEKEKEDVLEFLEEPISESNSALEKKSISDQNEETTRNFTWTQKATRPKICEENEESTMSTDEVEKDMDDCSIVEPYDDAYMEKETDFSKDLLPPGFEPPATSKVSPKKAIVSNSEPKNQSSILPIRTLYNQLKHHRLTMARKRLIKAKIYGPHPYPKPQKEIMKPAGPELPPADQLVTNEVVEKPVVKKIKKKSSNNKGLTPEFLAELERKKLEHENDMKSKMDLLENLKAKRQKLTNRERDMENDLKKKLELGIFDQPDQSVTPKKIMVTKKSMDQKIELESEDSSDENILTIDSRKDEKRRVDVDEDDLLIVTDDEAIDKKSIISDKPNESIGENMKFPAITVSIKASTSGQLVRSVMAKGKKDDDESDDDERSGGIRSSVGVVERRVSNRRRSDSSSEDDRRGRDRYDDKEYERRRNSHAYHYYRHKPHSQRRDAYEGNIRYRSSDDSHSRHTSDHRYYPSDQKRKIDTQKSWEKKVQNVEPPKPPVIDEAFQKQAELLELELRAKAIRSLMKVQAEEKEDGEVQ